jgi:hypothetical protein
MQVTSLPELRKALRAATPGDMIELAPGEYRGPLLIEVPVTLRGRDRRTVLWRQGGPVIYVKTPGVKLEKLLLERTVYRDGPLVVHDADCAPIGKESKALDTLISLGNLLPGSTLTLPLALEIADRTEIVVTGLHGAQVAPNILETPGTHTVWLTLDGNAMQRGEVLLGELTLREGDATRYLWLSGMVSDTLPPGQAYCLVSRKTRLYPSQRGLMLDGLQLSRLEGASLSGHYGYVGRDSSGCLFLYLPDAPTSPVSLNGETVPQRTRFLLKEKDTIKIGSVSLSVQPAEPPSITVEPPVLTFADFDEGFPDPVTLTVRNGKSAWKGRIIAAAPWLDVLPEGDFRIPPSRSNDWTIQLNSQVLDMPNGLHEAIGGLLVVGTNQALGVDASVNIRRPDVALQIAPLEAGSLEWQRPVEQVLDLRIGNLGRGIWTGNVRPAVPWLQVITPMPVSCGPWSEIVVQFQLTPSWDNLPVGTYALPRAIMVETPNGEIAVPARLEITPARGHITAVTPQIAFDQAERNAPLPDSVLEIRNDGGAPWTGTIRAVNGWVRLRPDTFTEDNAIPAGASAEVEVHLLDIPADLALDTPILVDEVRLEGQDESETVGVQLTVVELPPFLIAHTVNFAPFVRGDSPPEGLLRIHNNGPARWRGTVIANHPGLNVPDGFFVCEPGTSVDLFITLNSKALDTLKAGLNQWDAALSVTGGREPVNVAVQIDLRDPISELYLDTPTLNFGQIDAAMRDLPSQVVRLVNAGPAATSVKVEICVPWLTVKGQKAAFEVAVPGANVVEFTVNLTNDVRQLPPGLIAEDRALVITDREQQMVIQALMLINETAPIVAITPDKVTITGDQASTFTVQNMGKRTSTLQISAASWLSVTPAESSLEPEQKVTFEVKRTRPVSDLRDPRGIVLIGTGREFEVEVSASA